MKFQNPLQGFFSFLYIFIIYTFPDQKKGSDVDDHQLDPGGTSSLRCFDLSTFKRDKKISYDKYDQRASGE